MYDIIIAGAGPAGLTAALYAARAGLSALTVERSFAGGQMAISNVIENYPGFEEEQAGAVLANSMRLQAIKAGAEIVTEEVRSLDLKGPVKTVVTSNNTYEAKTVILAMGAFPRLAGVKGEKELIGSGVSYCATCDGAFYRNSDVAMLGGGNTAVEDAMYLSKFCTRVYLVHRREQFRAQKMLVERARKIENIEIVTPCIPVEFMGENAVSALLVENVKTKERRELPVKGIFVAVGRIPKSSMVEGQLKLNAEGYIVAGENCQSSVPGVFCAGDIRTKRLRQIVTAAADGASAVTAAEDYIMSL